MPTIKTVGPGKDYSKLQDWWDWAKTQSNADQWAECYGGGNLGPLDTSGGYSFTPDSANYVRIYAAPGHKHNLTWDTSKAHIDAGDVGSTDTTVVKWHVNYGRIEGIQIKGEGFARLLNDYGNSESNGFGGPYHYTDLLLIGGAGSTDNKVLFETYIRGNSGQHAYITNCTFVNMGYFCGFTQNGASAFFYIYNCAFINCGGGVGGLSSTRWALTSGVTHQMKNCVIVNEGAVAAIESVFAIGNVALTNCFITDDTATTTGWSQTDCTENGSPSGQFVNIASDWKILNTSDFVGAGIDLSSEFTTDAVGNTRYAPWWIGSYQAPLYDSDLMTFSDGRIRFSSDRIVFTP